MQQGHTAQTTCCRRSVVSLCACLQASHNFYVCDQDDVERFCRTDQMGKLTDDDSDVILVVGVNHAMANTSAYSSLSVYDQPTLWGIATVGDADMQGTALHYMNSDKTSPELQQALPYLYAYQFKRTCSLAEKARGCLEIASRPSSDGGVLFVPLDHPVVFAERMCKSSFVLNTHIFPSYSICAFPQTTTATPFPPSSWRSLPLSSGTGLVDTNYS